ncbi:hypothetical protein QN277_004880 [Acacia crassicarpa]|nr:hypothetical protein QN277_004880 [Acacia crassicarpa]
MVLALLRGKLVSLLQKRRTLEQCKQIHSVIIVSGFSNDSSLLCKLIRCTAFCLPASLSYASFLISTIYTPFTRLFNKMIEAFSYTPYPHMSLFCYARMLQTGVHPDKHTFPSLLKTFSKSNIQDPLLLYAQILKFGLHLDLFVRNALIFAFANSGFMECAYRVFDESSLQDVVTWTALIDGHVKNDCPGEALRCFVKMRSKGTAGIDGVVVVSILRAAALSGDDYFGRWIHGFYIVGGRVQMDSYICSALTDMYIKCGNCDDARKVFDEMPHRNVVSWTVLINGYVQFKRYKDALLVFQDMLSHNIEANEFTLTAALHACAHIGGLEQGRLIHQYIDRNKLSQSSALSTALVDMYAKCGCIDQALLLFEKLPAKVKDVYTWTAIINGLAVHGNALRSLELFSRMLRSGVQPNEVTFIAILSACSHGGLVDEGKRFFEMMRHDYDMEPNMDHYGCMVDLLGRAGYLEDAKRMIDEMPMKPNAGVVGALLGACMIHKDFKLGEHLGNYLINLRPNHGGAYALLANFYSMFRNWEAVAQVRKLMKGKGVEKTSGCSWIQVNGLIHEFKAFDHSHKESSSVCSILENVLLQLKLVGQTYKIEDSFIFIQHR